MQEKKNFYLDNMGIERWVLRADCHKKNQLQQLTQEVSQCTHCSLAKTRRNTVFARGNPEAKLMLIGEAPGFHEDEQGLPFVGKAGMLLNAMMKSIGLSQNDFYIANVLKCRPPNNRDPQVEEINQCKGYLERQIALIKPTLILALGRFAGHFLTKNQAPLNQLRNKLHHYEEAVPFYVTYHPAYLLRNPADKKKAYLDLLQVQHYLLSHSR